MQSSEVVGADLYHTTIGKVVLGNHGWDLKGYTKSLICRELELQNSQKKIAQLWNAFQDDAYTPEI